MGINDNKTTNFDHVDSLGALDDVHTQVGYVVRKAALYTLLDQLGAAPDEMRHIEVITNTHDGKEGGFDEVRFRLAGQLDEESRYDLYIDVEPRDPSVDHLVEEEQESWMVLIKGPAVDDGESRRFTYYGDGRDDEGRAEMAREAVRRIAEFWALGTPQRSHREYRSVLAEARGILSDSDGRGTTQGANIIGRIRNLLGPESKDLRGVWEDGGGDVRESTIENVEIVREHAKDLRKMAREAHGNSPLSNYEVWMDRLIRDLDKLDLGEIDWKARADEEAVAARDAIESARETLLNFRGLTNRSANDAVGILQDREAGEDAYREARQIRAEMETVARRLEDIYPDEE